MAGDVLEYHWENVYWKVTERLDVCGCHEGWADQ